MVKRDKDKEKRLGTLPKDDIGTFYELTWTAIMILYAYFNDELILIVMHGKQGYGKSTLAAIVSAQCYGVINLMNDILEENNLLEGKTLSQQRKIKIKLFERLMDENAEFKYDWKATKKYFAFKPEEFLISTADILEKIPTSIVDDAGIWLNAMDYHNPFVKAVGKFFEAARTKYGAIIFTCSDLKQIFTKLRDMPHVYTIRIIKESKTDPDSRIGIIHEGWESEDLKKSGRTVLLFDGFVAHMPEPFFEWYQPIRTQLANEAVAVMVKEYKKVIGRED